MIAAHPSAPECPKCGFRTASVPANGAVAPDRPPSCPRCGLTFALWTAEQDAAVSRLDDRAEALWSAAVASWQAPDTHDAFLKHCSLAGTLPAAGRRYRERLDEHPDDAVAARMQERILAMATATLLRPTALPTPVTRTGWFWMVMLLFGLGGVVTALFLKH
jgi:hypothetical protein